MPHPTALLVIGFAALCGVVSVGAAQTAPPVREGTEVRIFIPAPAPLRTLEQTLPGDLPDAITAAVRVNFHRLSADAQAVLKAAAVLDGRLSDGTLARVSRLSEDALAAALDELEVHRWLAADARGYSFVARIVRDVIARDMVLSGERQRLRALAAPPLPNG